MELDYYSLKSAAAKIGCIEEDLISLAAENKLSIYFKLGGRAILEMDRGCPDEWQETAFYLWTQLKIHPLTFQRYQSNPSTLISELMNPDDPEEPGYWLKESVPLKETTLFVSADDVARLSQLGDYRRSKSEEPDYYQLNLAAKITGYTMDYLICLAADNKLPIYVRLPGNSGIELKETGDPESPDVDGCYLRGLYKVPVFTIQEYINDPLTSLWCLRKYPDNGYYYNLDTKIPLTKIALYISAEDVARLSKNGNDGVVSQEATEPASAKVIQAETTGDANVIIHDDAWMDDPNLLKLEKQHKAILKVIALKKFDPMAIPDGEKSGSIKTICETDYPLIFDRDNSFDEAWKQGRKKKLFRMANHASYAKRGRK